jgi:propionyl-CoA carboxylase alpha chain
MSELESLMTAKSEKDDQTELLAPLAGQIVAVKVKEGDTVLPGQEMIVLTAMKMENVILAEYPAKIAKVHIKEKDHVFSGKLLLEFE